MFGIFYTRTTSSLISVIQPHCHWDFPCIFSYENRRAEGYVLTSAFSVLNLLEHVRKQSLRKFLGGLRPVSVTAEQGTHVKSTAQLEG